jgi:hypothetical protein
MLFQFDVKIREGKNRVVSLNYRVFISISLQSWRWRIDCERTTRQFAE